MLEPGFQVLSVTPVDEFNLTVYELEHVRTGARYVHVDRDDTDNAFMVAFRTPPKDDTGVAHILEHTVLCGSKRFPVRDPFFNMLKRSLKTFMNAMTAADYTMYPFSTQNATDFDNLQSVYMDAVFFPHLREEDFHQEGHRVEFADPDDPTSPLTFKGVVYNEMKGAMSDTSAIFSQRLDSALFPSKDVTYHYNSGGEPRAIPDLTHEQLREFHATKYHPSNAVFMSYGTFPPALHKVDREVLQHFDRAPPEPEVALQERFTQPVRLRVTCPEDPMVTDPEKQTKVAVAWLCDEVFRDPVETVGMQMLSTLLVDGPMAPLYQSLIDPNIGQDYSPGTGYSPHHRQAAFSVGLQGIREDDVERVEQIIHDTLERVANGDGFEQERIEAVLHQIEAGQKHVRSHFGLSMLMRTAPTWVHRANIPDWMHLEPILEGIKQRLREGPFFQDLIKRHLLNNQHKVTMVMHPDPAYAQAELEHEQRRLTEIEATLSPEDRAHIVERARRLREQQEQVPDTSCLPTLTMKDIDPQLPGGAAGRLFDASAPRTSVVGGTGGTRVLGMDQPTNGMVYTRALFDTHDLAPETRALLPFFASVATSMGAGDLDYRQLSHQLELHTAGVGADAEIIGNLGDLDLTSQKVMFSASALERKVPQAYELFGKILSQARFDDPVRLEALYSQYIQGLVSSLQDSGHVFARSWAARGLSASGHLGETQSGITHVRFMNQFAGQMDRLVQELNGVAAALLEQGVQECLVTATEDGLSLSDQHLSSVLSPLRAADAQGDRWLSYGDLAAASGDGAEDARTGTNTFFAVPLQVNHAAMSVPTVPYMHEDSAKLSLLGQVLTSCFLHREIREKGGAYGGGAGHSGGVFSFVSFRDPNTEKTVDAFRRSVEWLLESDKNVRSSDVEEAMLSLFSNIDAPTPPSRVGFAEHVSGITREMKQKRRQELLATTKRDLVRVAEKYLAPDRLRAKANVAIVGDQDQVPQTIRDSDEWVVERLG